MPRPSGTGIYNDESEFSCARRLARLGLGLSLPNLWDKDQSSPLDLPGVGTSSAYPILRSDLEGMRLGLALFSSEGGSLGADLPNAVTVLFAQLSRWLSSDAPPGQGEGRGAIVRAMASDGEIGISSNGQGFIGVITKHGGSAYIG